MATPKDENRYFAGKRKIDFFYAMLQSFCQVHQIPAHFVLNFDEEGHEEYWDSKKVKVVVLYSLPPHSSNQTQPLDLGIFHLHKNDLLKFIILGEDEKAIIEKIKERWEAMTAF